jgi:dipeptidyl aminopeptidase/acylaminoacyl peptidase
MNDRELREALRRAAPEDPAARERSWRVVQAAYGEHVPRPRRRRWLLPALMLALAPAVAGGVAAASAPDSSVGRWVRGVLGVGERDARPVLGRVPGGGRLLVQAGGSAWVVSADGAKRRLGAYDGTSWSPNGLFVVGWRGRELTALSPDGRVRWSLAPREPVRFARWGPIDGFRIAYVAGDAVRIVNGDGSDDRALGAAVARVAPAWRPDDRHVLAYAGAGERVSVVAVDSRRRLWRSGPLPGLRALAWSPGGRRLLAVTRRRLVLFDRSGERLGSRAIVPGAAVTAAEWSPRGREIAVVRLRAASGVSELVLVDAARGLRERTLFTGPGRFGGPAWSPDARRLLLAWPDADQWLFLRRHGGARLTAVANVAEQFAPGGARPAFPRSVQWCCAP